MSTKLIKKYHVPAIALTLLFGFTGGKSLANNIYRQDRQNIILAQSSTNLCRQVNVERGLAVRARPDANSAQIGGLDPNQQVILASASNKITGADDRLWVEIVSPINGYVALGYPNNEINLINCGEIIGNQPESYQSEIAMVNLCRQVGGNVAPEGLGIYADASKLSPYRGGLPPGGRVMLVPNYQPIADRNGEPNNWVQIIQPIAGFIQANSLMMCDDVGRSLNANTPISTTGTTTQTNATVNSPSTILNPELCRRVEDRFAPDGLAIRADAATTAAYLGGVEPGEDVYLVPNYQEIRDRNDSSRSWLEITAPIPGFISAGNLIMCR